MPQPQTAHGQQSQPGRFRVLLHFHLAIAKGGRTSTIAAMVKTGLAKGWEYWEEGGTVARVSQVSQNRATGGNNSKNR